MDSGNRISALANETNSGNQNGIGKLDDFKKPDFGNRKLYTNNCFGSRELDEFTKPVYGMGK